MKSLFEKPHLHKDVNRNAFDISQKRVSHSPFGALLPCFYKRVPANSYVEIAPESQTICDKIVRPAFIRLKEDIDFYAVPVSQLWHPFDNFITGQDNYDSVAVESFVPSSGNGSVPPQVPTFNSSFLEQTLLNLSRANDIHGYSNLINSLRLLDLLGYGNYYRLIREVWMDNALPPAAYVDEGVVTGSFNGYQSTNFFGLLAYQKVYYDYYRNPKYERCLTHAYNIDNLQPRQYSGSDITGVTDPKLEIFKMHYAWARKDYFTDVQPSILVSSDDIGYNGLVSNVPNNPGVFQLFGVPGAISYSTSRAATVQDNQNVSQNFQGETVKANAMYDVSNANVAALNGVKDSVNNITAIRFGFAYDKLLRRMREAGGTFDKQMLAQFGITPYDARNGKCTFLGGQTNRLNASDITNVSNQNLGELGSQINVYSSPRNTFKFTAKEDTIIIGIYHTSLDFDYPSSAVIRENLSTYRFDWFNPAFQNLGLQPLYKIELNNLLYQDGRYMAQYLDNSDERLALLGYVRRYSDYKTNIDKVYGLYDPHQGNHEFSAWVAPYLNKVFDFDGDDTEAEDDVVPFSRKQMTFNPAQLNSVLSEEYNGLYETDPFQNHFYVHCKLIANMSIHGEEF